MTGVQTCALPILVAAEYLRIWEDDTWGTMLRSTDPIVVGAIRRGYPELVPYLAPVTTPPAAESRYLRARYGPGRPITYAGVTPPEGEPALDAAITFADLEELFRLRGVSVLTQPDYVLRVPEERRRYLSAAGGLPLAMLEEVRHSSRRFRKVRGLEGLASLARAVSVDRLDLGFVDILSYEGSLDHPLSGPRDQVYWRRALLESAEPARSRYPVVDGTVVRQQKAYPVYDGVYAGYLEVVKQFLSTVANFQTIGRNGLHKYNNQDHSMLTAILAVQNLLGEGTHDLWQVNTDRSYHEEVRVRHEAKVEEKPVDILEA